MIEEYLHSRRRHFEAEGFECLHDLEYGGYRFTFVAAKTRFTFALILPVFLREVFVFESFPTLTVAELQQFALASYDFAHFQLSTKPLGQRLRGGTMSVYAVALVPAASDQLQEYVREHTPLSVPGGGWPIPVIYDGRLNLLHHFQKVPLIGNTFYGKFQKVLKQRLAPNAPASPSPPLFPEATTAQGAVTTAPATRTKRHWLQRPAFRGIAGSGTLPVAINTERARRFLERLRQRQSLGRALALGLPAVAAMGLIWGVVNGMSGVSLEWLPLAGMGYVLGTCVRAAGKGIDHRFGVAGAALTLLGCMVSRLLALWIVVPSQVSGRNFSLLQDAPLDVSLRLLIDGTDAYSVAALAASVCQGYYFALYRITPQEMSYLADEGPPR